MNVKSIHVDFAVWFPWSYWTWILFVQPAGGQSNILFGEDPVVKSSKKIHNQKFQELTGNDIFKGDVPPGSAEKSLSRAKLKEMSGNDIFADGKSESRDYYGGVRKPPGGESKIALVWRGISVTNGVICIVHVCLSCLLTHGAILAP